MTELMASPVTAQSFPKPQLRDLTWSGILGAILVFGLFTDYSWNNLWANLFFPPIVGLFGMRNYRDSKPLAISTQQKWFRRACCLPSMIFGLSYLVIMIMAVIPPFTLATGFGISEEIDSTIVQEITSPNQLMIAKVSYEPSGAYTSGLGSAHVQIVYRFLPIVKRDLYTIGTIYGDVDRTNWIEWRDDDTLYIYDDNETISIGVVRFQFAQVFMAIVFAIIFAGRLVFNLFTGS